jgi:hypothetical protein
VLIVFVLGVFVVYFFQMRSPQKAGLPGTCTVEDYYEGDAVEVQLMTVTTTIGGTTSYYTEYSTAGTPTPEVTASSTYTTSAPANTTVAHAIATTSIDQDRAPVGVWYVTVCTFGP